MSPPEGPEESWHPVSASSTPSEATKPLPANWFGPLDEVRRGRKTFDRRRVSHWLAGAAMVFVIGMILLSLVNQLYLIAVDEAPEQALGTETLVMGLLINMLIFIGVPVLWVSVMYYGGMSAVRERLLLQSHGIGKDLLIGIGAGVLGLIVSYVMILIFTLLGLSTENPVVEDLGPRLTWALVVFVPFAAATSEEVFFRGYLHPRVGIVPANVLFGFVHLSYQTPLQVIVPMILGFVLSMTLVRRRSLLPAIVAHFVFNFVALTLTKLAHDLGWDDTMGLLFLGTP